MQQCFDKEKNRYIVTVLGFLYSYMNKNFLTFTPIKMLDTLGEKGA